MRIAGARLDRRQAEPRRSAIPVADSRREGSRHSTRPASRFLTLRPTPRSLTSSRRPSKLAQSRLVMRLPYHINDPAFAKALVEQFLSLPRE